MTLETYQEREIASLKRVIAEQQDRIEDMARALENTQSNRNDIVRILERALDLLEIAGLEYHEQEPAP